MRAFCRRSFFLSFCFFVRWPLTPFNLGLCKLQISDLWLLCNYMLVPCICAGETGASDAEGTSKPPVDRDAIIFFGL